MSEEKVLISNQEIMETKFQPVKNHTLQTFRNIFHQESFKWWKSKKWWVQTLIWQLILIGGVIVVLNIAQFIEIDPNSGALISYLEPWIANETTRYKFYSVMNYFVQILIMIGGISVAILVQNVIIEERDSGKIEWILSNPASRSAYITGKIVANMIPILIIIVVLPGIALYILLSIQMGVSIPIILYIETLAILALALMYFISLTIMLGVFFNKRGIVIGVPIALTFISSISTIQMFFPSGLTSTALCTIIGFPSIEILPVIVVSLAIIAFIVASIIKFNHEEF